MFKNALPYSKGGLSREKAKDEALLEILSWQASLAFGTEGLTLGIGPHTRQNLRNSQQPYKIS